MLSPAEIKEGKAALIERMEQLEDAEPDIGTFHDAFGQYCMEQYTLGSRAESVFCDEKNDRGIDSYSADGAKYHVIQTKIPPADWLRKNPDKVKHWGPITVKDPTDAFEYLFEDAKKNANDKVRHLYGMIQQDRQLEEFSFTYFLVVYGRLDKRSKESFEHLQNRFKSIGCNLILRDIDSILNDFIVGNRHSDDKIVVKLHVHQGKRLSQHNYHYFLAPAGDLFRAFIDYGWRLFDLNVRYEIRNSPVNGDIVKSLSSSYGRKSFHHFNNGLIIVADNVGFKDGGEQVKLKNAQIVNGLQTVKSIYNAVTTQAASLEALDSNCFVQVKVIQNNVPEFVSQVVQATNNQNPMSRRNLRSNSREQGIIQTKFSGSEPRWFYQRKQGEWDSLTSESGQYFKMLTHYPVKDFRPERSKKRGRVIDNRDLAKAWLAFIGFPDWAGDRTSHFFDKDDVYRIAFMRVPTDEHWAMVCNRLDIVSDREKTLEDGAAGRHQYLLAFAIWTYIRGFLPSPQTYRAEGLEEGHREGKIVKSGGSFKGAVTEHDSYLADNTNYQVWRVMSNMKELLVLAAAHLLYSRYGTLDDEKCKKIFSSFDLAEFELSGVVKHTAEAARVMTDLPDEMVFGRIFHFLRFVVQNYWEDKRTTLLATSRLRTYLIRKEAIADIGHSVEEVNRRKGLDKGWKPEGVTFIESLPDLSEGSQLKLT